MNAKLAELWRLLFARGTDGTAYCRGCEYEVPGHATECPVKWLGDLFWLPKRFVEEP